ncbi:GerAB/ArcD/ProY family transporter [Paenibacillus amylolyticus]|nr:GerAB/ArcD/ProY family transporter [Paenibacillus amylolyticus]
MDAAGYAAVGYISPLLFSSIYLVRQKLRIIARVLVLISFLILPMMVLISYGLKEINLLYLLPLTEAGWPKIISGST